MKLSTLLWVAVGLYFAKRAIDGQPLLASSTSTPSKQGPLPQAQTTAPAGWAHQYDYGSARVYEYPDHSPRFFIKPYKGETGYWSDNPNPR